MRVSKATEESALLFGQGEEEKLKTDCTKLLQWHLMNSYHDRRILSPQICSGKCQMETFRILFISAFSSPFTGQKYGQVRGCCCVGEIQFLYFDTICNI